MLQHQHTRASAPPPASPIRSPRAAKRSERAAPGPDRQQVPAPAAMRQRAEAYIAGARECGLVLVPVLSLHGRVAVAFFGQDKEGPNDFDSAWNRFAYHPARTLRRALEEGALSRALCEDFGVDPADADFLAKIDAKLMADRAACQPHRNEGGAA